MDKGWAIILFIVFILSCLWAYFVWQWDVYKTSENECAKAIHYPCDTYAWCKDRMDSEDCKQYCTINMNYGDPDDYCYTSYCSSLGSPPKDDSLGDSCLADFCRPKCNPNDLALSCGGYNDCTEWYCSQTPTPQGCGWDRQLIPSCEDIEHEEGCNILSLLNNVFSIECLGIQEKDFYLMYEDVFSPAYPGLTFTGGSEAGDYVPITARKHPYGRPELDDTYLWVLRDADPSSTTKGKYILQAAKYEMRRFSMSRASPNKLVLDNFLNGHNEGSLNTLIINVIGKNCISLESTSYGKSITVEGEHVFEGETRSYSLNQAFKLHLAPEANQFHPSDTDRAYDTLTVMNSPTSHIITGVRTGCENYTPDKLGEYNYLLYNLQSAIGNTWVLNDGYAQRSTVTGWSLITCNLRSNAGKYIWNPDSNNKLQMKSTSGGNGDETRIVVEFSTWNKTFRLLKYYDNPQTNYPKYFTPTVSTCTESSAIKLEGSPSASPIYTLV